jgi:predicted DNA-binding transcriptional regulator AlpA
MSIETQEKKIQSASDSTFPQLVTDREAAKILGVSVSCMRGWRYAGRGPRFAKIGGSVRYARSDLAAFVIANMRGGQP